MQSVVVLPHVIHNGIHFESFCLTLKRREFRIGNKTWYTEQRDKNQSYKETMLSSLVQLTSIKLSFCVPTGERGRGGGGGER